MVKDVNTTLVGQVFNIQRYSTHDGPGIRTTVFLKGCPLRCFWCQNPESQSMKPVLMYRRDKCTQCGRCVALCPHGASRMVDGQLVLDRSLCVACGTCVQACPLQARNIEGKGMTVEEVLSEVMKDYYVYANSGGGMTISGGDCEMQPEFTIALLKAAHEEGLHNAVEITGAFPWETVKSIIDHTDFVLFDLKCIDDDLHKEGTGVSNKRILENAKKLVKEKKEVIFRTPLIPGYNDSHESVTAIAKFVRDELGLSPVDHLELLAYNNLGEDKYLRLDCLNERPQYKRQSEEYIKELHEICALVDAQFSETQVARVQS